jgi:hypothetical protein
VNENTISRSLIIDMLEAAGFDIMKVSSVSIESDYDSMTITAKGYLSHYDGSLRVSPITHGLVPATETRTFSLTT